MGVCLTTLEVQMAITTIKIPLRIPARNRKHKPLYTYFVQCEKNGIMDRWIRFLGLSGGMTWGKTVYVRNDAFYKKVAKPWRKLGGERSTFIKHEQIHHEQCYRSGSTILQGIKYASEWLFIYLFRWGKHPYWDNRYEVEARTRAGQVVPYPWKHRGINRWNPFGLSAKASTSKKENGAANGV